MERFCACANPQVKDVDVQPMIKSNVNFQNTAGNTLLHIAVLKGNVELGNVLLATSKCDVNIINREGQTPLDIAIKRQGNMQLRNNLICMLLKQQNECCNTVLHHAAIKGYVDICKLCLTRKYWCDPNLKNSDGSTPLHLAVFHNRIEIAQILAANKHCSPNVTDRLGNTPLHVAVLKGSTELISIVMSNKQCDLNLPNNDGKIPLYIAIQKEHVGSTSLLLKNKNCNPNFSTHHIDPPFHCAVTKGNLELCTLLLANDQCYPNIKDRKNDPPLHVAVAIENTAITQTLVNDQRCNPNLLSNQGNSSLHYAVMKDNRKLCQVLLSSNRCDPNIQNTLGNTPLHIASKITAVVLLSDKYCNPNLANHDGNTPLHLASAAGNNELCSLILVNNLCDPNILNNNGATPLHIATMNHDVEVMKSLISHHDCNPNIVYKDDKKLSKKFYPALAKSQGNTPLHSAVCKGNTFLCKIILSSEKCNINVPNASGNTPLLIATWRGYVEVVHMLVNDKRYDSDIEQADKNGNVSLHIACATGNATLCEIFLQQCNPNIQNGYGNTPLHIATIYGNNDIACMLTAHGSCDPTRTNRHGNCPLHIAAKKGNIELCKLFIAQEQSSLNIRNKVGKTPLHIAASCPEYSKVLQVFVNHKQCDPNIQDTVGNTPLHIATTHTNPHHALGMSGHVTVCKLILSNAHCDPNIQNTVGSTPLHIATSHQNLVLMQLLIEDYRCSPKLRDRDGNTPLHIAAANSNPELVNLLLSNGKSKSSLQNTLGNTALHVAIAHENLTVVKVLICSEDWYAHLANIIHDSASYVAAKSENTKLYELLHTANNEGSTPLHRAVLTDNKELCALLLVSQCCDPNSQDKAGNTPLHYAAWLRSKETVQLFLNNQHCNPCIQDCHGTTPLHVATEREDVQLCELLVSHRECDVNLQDVEGKTPLHIATECIDPNLRVLLVQTLIHHKHCNPNVLDIKGSAPLHVAAKRENVELCNLLLSHRECNINLQDGERKTTLHIATAYSEPNVSVLLIQILLAHKQCNPNIPDLKSNTPLHIAAEKGSFNVIELILADERCNPNLQNSEHQTPLHIALSNNNTVIAKALIHHQQCDIKVQDMNGNTPLHLAIQQCKSHIATMLMAKKCSLTIPNSAGNTPLHIACVHAGRDPDILELARNLLSSTAVDPSCVNNAGQTPVELTTNYQLIQDISHFTECKTKHSVQTYIKLFILGNPSTGKSTLVKAICKEASFWWKFLPEPLRRVRNVSAKTAGIIPTTFRSKTFGNTILYDLAGQYEYYSSHAAVIESAVFSSPPAFLVVINLSEDDDKMIKQLKYWWSFISNHAARASAPPHAILVGSHADILIARGDKVDGKLFQLSSALATLSSSFHFGGQVALDCRDPVSRGLNYLCSLVNASCTVLRTSADVDLHCHTLYAFLLERFANVVACTVSDIVSQIRGKNMLLPKTPADLLQLLSSLTNRGLILLVKNSERVGNGWVILQKHALLNEVSGTMFAPDKFSEHRNFSSTGIVPISRLREEFPQYDTRMIVEFLTDSEFCFKVDDEEILYKISEELSASDTALAYQTAKTSDEFYFFPGLIGVDNPLTVWKADDSMHYKCGWHCESTDPDKFLTTRFLHVLILRLAFIFTLKHVNHQQLSPVLCKRCSLWKHGIGWLNEDGVEVVVEVGIQNLGITVLMRCPDDCKMRCVELRSRVIHKVLLTKEEFCPALEMFESFIHPTQIRYPVTICGQLYLLTDISNAIIKNGERVVDQHGQSSIRIEGLLFFEPYVGIDGELLNELFSEDNTYKIVPESCLAKLAVKIDTRMPFYREVIKPEKIAFEEAISKEGIIARQCLILLRALCHRINPTYYNFHTELDRFSIFCGRNPITRAFPTSPTATLAHR